MGGCFGRCGRLFAGATLTGRSKFGSALSLFALLVGCASNDPREKLPQQQPPPPPPPSPIYDLRINEVVSSNEGVWIDEFGETDDYIEIYNAGSSTRQLENYLIFESSGGHPLPKLSLAPKQTVLLWADGTPEQGELHLAFKISSAGERLRIVKRDPKKGDSVVDEVEVPALAEHHAYLRVPDGTGEFKDCGWATPGRENGKRCGPQEQVTQPNPNPFAAYSWPAQFPNTPTPLAITEARLLPADFVEVKNTSARALNLSQFSLRFAAKDASMPWPGPKDGVEVPWPRDSLAPGEYLRVPVPSSALAEIAARPNYEGVVSTVDVVSQLVADRLEFSDWPNGASLARNEQSNGQFRFCATPTPGVLNDECDPLARREIRAGYIHDFYTPGDFQALGTGHAALGEVVVEALVNLELGNTVTFINSNVYEWHYDFVHVELEKQRRLDRCSPQDNRAWTLGWAAFVRNEYESPERRRWVPCALVHHGGANLTSLEFATAAKLTPDQLETAFFSVVKHVPDPKSWAVRPQTPEQVEMFRPAEGRLPLVGTDAAYANVKFQALVLGTSYGTLRVASVDELPTLNLSPRDIVLTDGIPNDIPLIAGLMTETFQTPLAHVNVLSRSRGTPNMALRDARNDPRVVPFIGKLVRLDVLGSSFELSLADPAEALAFWESRKPSGETLTPRLDLSRRGVVPLETSSLSDIPLVGGKAAQFAELAKVEFCDGDVSVPDQAFAIPLVHSLEHYEQSGANTLLAELHSDPNFLADPATMAAGLARVRDLITKHPVDQALHDEVATAIALRWPSRRVRFRSSSNVEDLAGFNGAGLYLSEGIEAENTARDMDDAIRAVWASLWNARAFSEREYYSVDQSQVAMAVLIHPGFPSERANGVAVSRSVIDPNLQDIVYVNAQVGEALVTNPAPGILSDEFSYDLRADTVSFNNRSSFSPEEPVLSLEESAFLVCNLRAIHDHFQPLLDPEAKNPWFAMDIEFKLMGPARSLVIKQARSYSFGKSAADGWCEF
ncbi:MAG: PEP/pyruvate-binding domain-containing protein [Myxococcota bacterium]